MRYRRNGRDEEGNLPRVRESMGRVDYGYDPERRVYMPAVYDEEPGFSWWDFTMEFCVYLFLGAAMFNLVFLALILTNYRF